MAVLTNGLNWWLYLPLKEGEAEARRFCELDVSNQDVPETCESLIKFLARENVYSGAAVENAEARLKRLQEDRALDKALPRAWDELIDGPDGLLVDLINDKVKGLCGVEAGPERIREFLVGLGKVRPVGPESHRVEKKEPIEHLSSIDLSTVHSIEDKELLHATLSDIVETYVGHKYVHKRDIRAMIRKHMIERGFTEFYIHAEWGGIKSDRERFCKIDLCEAQHAINRRN